MREMFRRVALLLFCVYVAVFPGSTWTVAMDRVPGWGVWFGAALLVLQGAAVLAWLGWIGGWRGLASGLMVGLLGFAVEYVGETTGFPFGRYTYSEVLQPQILGVVPLAICCAWVMAAPSAYAIARTVAPRRWSQGATLLLAATLVLLLDLQIETVAAYVNGYWVWRDVGPYYGVPTANFVAWWLVGLGMAALVGRGVGASRLWGNTGDVAQYLPHAIYLLSTLMFAAINLSHGYVLAGLIGVAVLLAAGVLVTRAGRGYAARQILRRRLD